MPASRPLPRNLRGDLEELLGAGFRDVRLRELPPGAVSPAGTPAAGAARGEDVYLAPGTDLAVPAGQEVLAHELAHVLQQRHGRVRPGAGPALEAEAAAAGRAAARGRPARVPGRPAARPTVAAQYYQVIQQAGRLAANLVVQAPAQNAPSHPDDSFLGQDKGGAGALGAGSFWTAVAPGGPNLSSANPATVPIRVSAGGHMAVEDASLLTRQPKACYLTQAVINASNLALGAAGSSVRLAADPAGGAQRVDLGAGAGAAQLLRVVPQLPVGPVTGLAVTRAQACNQLVHQVTGRLAVTPQLAAALPGDVPGHVLREFVIARAVVAAAAGAAGLPAVPAVPDASAATAAFMRGVAQAWSQAALAAAGAFTGRLQALHLNEYAVPAIGQAFLTVSLTAPPPGTSVYPETHHDFFHLAGAAPQVIARTKAWSTHYGSVVAVDGTDVLTLENYARSEEGGPPGDDNRWYFQMYDTGAGAGVPGAAARSWHGTWATIPMAPIVPVPAAPPGYPAASHQPASPGAKCFTNPITVVVG